MRIFHFVNREYGLQDLQLRRLKIATINDLNDPFELLGPATTDCDIRRAFEALKNQMANRFGILCFSRHWKNPVQWSHYADRHRGLCLGFEMPDDQLAIVTYSAKRPEPHHALLTRGHPNAHVEMLKLLSTKYSHWRYEREVRSFTTLDDADPKTNFYFMPFSENLVLKEVIVGYCSTVTRRELSNVLGDLTSKVATYKARLAFRSFTVVRQRNDSLWQ